MINPFVEVYVAVLAVTGGLFITSDACPFWFRLLMLPGGVVSLVCWGHFIVKKLL